MHVPKAVILGQIYQDSSGAPPISLAAETAVADPSTRWAMPVLKAKVKNSMKLSLTSLLIYSFLAFKVGDAYHQFAYSFFQIKKP
jgi:hypothetical protein